MDSNKKLKLTAVVDEELQKQLAVLNKEKTCLSVPLLGKNLQQWMYQEAEEGRWDQDMVFNVLERQKLEGGEIVSARVKNLGEKYIEVRLMLKKIGCTARGPCSYESYAMMFNYRLVRQYTLYDFHSNDKKATILASLDN